MNNHLQKVITEILHYVNQGNSLEDLYVALIDIQTEIKHHKSNYSLAEFLRDYLSLWKNLQEK
jgi:hypothetical protein